MYTFEQTEALTKTGIAVHKYGAVIIPKSQSATEITLVMNVNETPYTATTTINASTAVDTAITVQKPGVGG